jgi:hydrogenase expression/formation protein HypE
VSEDVSGPSGAGPDGNGDGSGASSSGPGKASDLDREQKILGIIDTARAKQGKFKDAQITMSHGAGGKATQSLIEGLLVPAFSNEGLAPLGDAGQLEGGGAALAMTTDSFVVSPLRFPGGSIGDLAVNGTVNDLAVSGAKPLALTLALILEEGLDTEILRYEVNAVATAASEAGVDVISGDTKVVERGLADSLYMCTAGVGLRDPRANLSTRSLKPGDRAIVSGTIGEHGTAIMLARGEFELDADIESDTCSLWPVADALMEAVGPDLRCMRDATRGGVASALNELARASSVAMVVREKDVQVADAVAGASDILGIDPLYVANEGKLVAFVAPEAAEKALATLRAIPGCERASEIAEVTDDRAGLVTMETAFGGKRMVDLLVGDPLPRIC